MKRIILISLVSFALFGCDEKKVTEEMLLGDWQCDFTHQVAKWKDGAFQDYAPQVDHDASLVTYLKEDDNLFIKFPDSDMKIKQDFKTLSEGFESSIYGIKTVSSNKLEYISYNEFKLNSEATMTQNKSEDNEKIKVIQHCIRIK